MSEKQQEPKPGWMSDRDADQEWTLAESDHDLAVAIAQYGKRFSPSATNNTPDVQDDENNLYHILTACAYAGCDDLSQWRVAASEYWADTLRENIKIKKSEKDVAARTIHLQAAIRSLLKIAGAPEAMSIDIEKLLSPLYPKGAEKRAKAQQAILDHPESGLRGAARISQSSPGQASADRKAGLIVMPAGGVWKTPG